MFHDGSLDITDVQSMSAWSSALCQKCFGLQTSLYWSTILGFFLYSKFHMFICDLFTEKIHTRE